MQISVRQASDLLGVSERRVRALIKEGRLTSRRLGERSLLVDRDSVDQRRSARPRRGRPVSARSAWAIIEAAAGRHAGSGSSSERLRARRRLVELPGQPPGYLGSRAAVHRMRGHPGVIERLREDPRLRLSGRDAARAHGADIVILDGVDAYVNSDDAGALVHDYALSPSDRSDANVIMRVVPPGVEIPCADSRVVCAALCALDLIDDGDERSVRAGRALLTQLCEASSP